MATFTIKQHDTAPAVKSTLFDVAGVAVNLTGATVRFHMKNDRTGVIVVNAVATIVSPTLGQVSYSWVAGDTANSGMFPAEWEVTFADATIQTFPNKDFLYIQINADLA